MSIKRVSFDWDSKVSVESLWSVLADTARFNEAAGFPKHDIEETPRADGSVEFTATARLGPFQIKWDDHPQNWIDKRWFRHFRQFHSGPMRSLCATYKVKGDQKHSKSQYTVEVEPANLLGNLVLRLGFFSKVERKFRKLAATAEEFCRGDRDSEFEFKTPRLVGGAVNRGTKIAKEIESSPYGHGLTHLLLDYVCTKPDVDVWSIRPIKLARLWRVPERKTVELCLQSTKSGLLALRWDLLCPRCQIGKLSIASLKELPEGTHCSSCNIDFIREFSNNVELAFYPSQSIRELFSGEYCLMGPMTTPHIKAQITLLAGETCQEEINLEPGDYRIRTLEPGEEEQISISDNMLPRIHADDFSITCQSEREINTLWIENHSSRSLTFILEELAWRQEALTAQRATTFQAFRDLFDEEVLRPGDDVEIDSITIMFTDLKGSTALYDRIGDPQAYVLVREHFVILGKAVRECNGSIVKMIGDAIMAVFHDPTDALTCGIRIHQDIETYNLTSSKEVLIIKMGLHTGRCISVTLNDKLDYYGSAANMAARLQGQSVGGDIVLSTDFVKDPMIQKSLQGFTLNEEHVVLKGFSEPVPYLRITEEELQGRYKDH